MKTRKDMNKRERTFLNKIYVEALEGEYPNIVEGLKLFEPKHNYPAELLFSIRYGSEDEILALVSRVKKLERALLCEVNYKCRPKVIEAMILKGVDVDTRKLRKWTSDGDRPIGTVIKKGAEEVVDLLLKHNVNLLGTGSLDYAIKEGHVSIAVKIAKELLRRYSTVMKSGKPIVDFLIAGAFWSGESKEQEEEILCQIVDLEGINVNCYSWFGGDTLLISSIKKNYLKAFRKLLSKKETDINKGDFSKITPLQHAEGKEPFYSELLQAGAKKIESIENEEVIQVGNVEKNFLQKLFGGKNKK